MYIVDGFGVVVLQNLILIDWLSVTSRVDDVVSLLTLLGFDPASFSVIAGAKGYTYRAYYDGISIHYGERPEVWLEMSGQGCRVFESFGTGDWSSLFGVLLGRSGYHITRVDIAFDDHQGLLDIDRIGTDVQAGNFVSRWRWWEVRRSSQGISVYHGSPKSDARIRIYDKAAERSRQDEGHWVRCELQLRDDRATEFLRRLQTMSLGVLFAGVVLNYLRYVVPCETDTNNRRWETADYWDRFIGTAHKISLYVAPGVEYNFTALQRYVVYQSGAAAAAYLAIVGQDQYFAEITDRLTASVNPKYTDLVHRCKF